MQLISKFNKEFRFFFCLFCFVFCVIGLYSKYAWVIPLKDKKGTTVSNAFQKILYKSNRTPNKIWVDKGSEFYNRSVKSWLEKIAIDMHSTHNEEKYVLTFKNKIYKYMTSISKNKHLNKLDNIVNK